MINTTEAPHHLSFPLSPEQRAVLKSLGESLEPKQPIRTQLTEYTIKEVKDHSRRMVIHLKGRVDEEHLRTTIEYLVQRHHSLRTAFRHMPGYKAVRQYVIQEPVSIYWQSVDLSGFGTLACERWLKEFEHSPFALDQGEMLRAALLRISEGEWQLVLDVSPLAADQGSLLILYRQLVTAYRRQEDKEAEGYFQYPQFVEWRQELENDSDAQEGRHYWAQYNREALAAASLQLPYRREGGDSRHSSHTNQIRNNWDFESCYLDKQLAVRISETAALYQTDRESVMQAVWCVVLARQTDKEFITGWQHDCRRDYEVMEGAVGVFEKVLPVRVKTEGTESCSQWLTRFIHSMQQHVAYQEQWPVENPPFVSHLKTGFCFNESLDSDEEADLSWSIAQLPSLGEPFECALRVVWGATGVQIGLQFLPSHYSSVAMRRLLEQYLTVLEHFLGHPDTLIQELPLVGKNEYAARLATALNNYQEFGADPLYTHIMEWAEKTPNALALESRERQLSYRQLRDEVRHMAAWLSDQGVQPETIVALNLERSVELVIALLAVWHTGAAYLPLEPTWPVARRQAILQDVKQAAQSVFVLYEHEEALENDGEISEVAYRKLSLNEFLRLKQEGRTLGRLMPPFKHPHPLQATAYVLYTSGSTGLPKGVVIEQAQLLNYVAAASSVMHLNRCRRWALTSTVAADLGNTALFGALFNGACLVIAASEHMQDGQSFSRFLKDKQIDALKIVPSHLEALLEIDQPVIPHTLVLGGEAPSPLLLARLREYCPEGNHYNHYGPTETTVGVMVHSLQAEEGLSGVPLTTVLPNNRLYVLNEHFQLTPTGAIGELCIGGAQLCRGYLNSEHTFAPDPFLPGETLYRTGDLAYVLPEPEGCIRLAGRKDDQIKIRGFRVEPAEIEAVLLAQPAIQQALVLPVDFSHEAEDRALAAFLVTQDAMKGAELSLPVHQDHLRNQLASVLPAHMLPAYFIFVSAFPRLANGKIDRKALMDFLPPVSHDNKEIKASVSSSDAVEAAVAETMAKLLGRATLDIEEDFFAAGGHSLLVIKLVARIRKVLKVELAPGEVFDYPTARQLALVVRQQAQETESLERLASAYMQALQDDTVLLQLNVPLTVIEGNERIMAAGERT